MVRKVPQPAGLGPGGKSLWTSVLAQNSLRPSDLRTLEDACREADLIDEMQAEQKGMPKTVKGSMGQVVAAPLVSEMRQHRATLNILLRSLKLPDVAAGADSASEAKLASERARFAARARWDRTRAG